jgi:hypothetical protein
VNEVLVFGPKTVSENDEIPLVARKVGVRKREVVGAVNGEEFVFRGALRDKKWRIPALPRGLKLRD